MAAGPSFPKVPKLATKSHDNIFDLFRKDSSAMEDLKYAREYLARPIEGFFLLKLLFCNGHRPVPISDACCEVNRSVCAGINTLFYYQSVFGPGFRILDDFMNSKPLPEDPAERLVLERLLAFLMSDLEYADKLALHVDAADKISETEWTVRLMHHLLSPLAADQNYSIDKQSKLPAGKGRKKCPCCGEWLLQGKFADTSIGNPRVWHGSMDVILGTEQNQDVAVHVADTDDDIQDVNAHDGDNDEESESSSDDQDSPTGNVSSSVEVKLSHYRFYCQLISETIVFSFLQKQFLKKDSNTLIPTIGVTRNKVYIFMYDHEHDMLLESNELKLRKRDFKDSNRLALSVPTAMALWLAINYKYTCSGTSESIRGTNFTADFPQRVGSVYPLYENEVKRCCGKGTADENYKGFKSYEHAKLTWSL